MRRSGLFVVRRFLEAEGGGDVTESNRFEGLVFALEAFDGADDLIHDALGGVFAVEGLEGVELVFREGGGLAVAFEQEVIDDGAEGGGGGGGGEAVFGR